jgi:hypothetical protein
MAFHRKLFWVVLFLIGNIGAQDPSYPQVMRHLYGTYVMEETTMPKAVHRRDGWHLVLQDFTNDGQLHTVAEHTLWRSGDRSWRRLPITRRSRPVFDADSLKQLGMRLDEPYRYERCRYYGYPQWSWDIIRDYGNELLLTPALLESLSRAYSDYAMGFIMPTQWGNAANATWPGRQGWSGKASTLQADSFEFYAKLGLKALQKLVEVDPNYEVLVGNARQKLANEYVFMAQTLIQAGFPERGLHWIQLAKYDPSMLDLARNMLAGLPSNAILISGGDNDTYPLWFLQIVAGVRRDVAVINLSLLAVKEYRDLISVGLGLPGRVQLKAHQRYRDREDPGYIMITARGKADARLLPETYYTGNKEIEADAFVLDSGMNRGRFGLRGSYIFSGQVHLIDLMLSNQRPVLFTGFCGSELSQEWQFIRSSGQHFMPSLYPEGPADSASVARWIAEEMICLRADSLADPMRTGTNKTYLGLFAARTALALDWCQNHKEEALKARILEKINCVFLPHQLQTEFEFGSLLGALYRSGEVELGNRMFAGLMNLLLQRDAFNRKLQESGTVPSDDALGRYQSMLPFVEYLEYEFSQLNPDIGRGVKRAERLAEVKQALSVP